MTESISYTGVKLPDFNGEVYIASEGNSFTIGIATPPPERPGDEPMMVALARFAPNEKGKMVSSRVLLPNNKRMRIYQKLSTTHVEIAGTHGREVITDIHEAELLKAYDELCKKLQPNKDTLLEKMVALMAQAESLHVPYRVCENERNKNALVLKIRLEGNDKEDECPINCEPWQYDNLKYELDAIAQQQEEDRRREEIKKQALAKLSPEERKALGFNA